MILAGVVFAAAVALLRGGKLERLGNLNLSWLPLVWTAIILRAAAGILAKNGFVFGPWLQVVAYVLFIYFVAVNSKYPGIKLFGLGSLANFLVIAANGGTMPVSAAAIAKAGITGQPAGTHSMLTAQSRLWFLADIIPVSFRLPMPAVVSVGDLMIVAGMFIFIQYRMLCGEEAKGLVLSKE
jgi:hypothetical protein